MLKSSIASPGASMSIEERIRVRYMLAKPGTFTLPLASSTINETDTIVRVQDGNIVAIGGLMKQESVNERSGLPGIGDAPGLGALFRQRGIVSTKSEIVILLKPTIVHSDRNWQQDIAETRERIRGMEPASPRDPIR